MSDGRPTRIGLILTPDNASDADFWRWCPPGVTLHVARNRDVGQDVLGCVAASTLEASDGQLAPTARSLRPIAPALVVFTCTSGSFVGGLAEERRIRDAVEREAGAPALTTTGCALDAIDALGVRRVAVATPYDAACTARLGALLEDAGLDVASLVNREPDEGDGLSDMDGETLRELVLRADRADADAVFVSCTGLATFDLIEPLEAELGKPVITAIQAVMWAAIGAVGAAPVPARQRLLARTWSPSPRRLA